MATASEPRPPGRVHPRLGKSGVFPDVGGIGEWPTVAGGEMFSRVWAEEMEFAMPGRICHGKAAPQLQQKCGGPDTPIGCSPGTSKAPRNSCPQVEQA